MEERKCGICPSAPGVSYNNDGFFGSICLSHREEGWKLTKVNPDLEDPSTTFFHYTNEATGQHRTVITDYKTIFTSFINAAGPLHAH